MTVELLDVKPDFLSLLQEVAFFPGILESQAINRQTGRFTILPAAPAIQFTAFDNDGLVDLFKTIDQKPIQPSTCLPFEYGWFVYLSYECVSYFEPKLSNIPMPVGTEPLAVAIYCQGAVVYDHLDDKCWVTAENTIVQADILQRIESNKKLKLASLDSEFSWQSESKLIFKSQVSQAKQLIESGDLYQTNLSRCWIAGLERGWDPLLLFSLLREANPAPFAAFFQTETWTLVSASPERLVQVKDGIISTRPIAGTRPRGTDKKQDDVLIKELLNTPKEQAEHIMLIDLERNDVGRVSINGTVEVDEFMVIETYPTVHHIVSNVIGRLKSEVSVVDVLASMFPGGTITGCPKIRCMEVIAELENRGRGFYTGSIGFINHDGQIDFNILIRSMGITGKQLKIFAGAGIVFDSDSQAELEETGHKAQGLFNILKSASCQ